MENMESLIIYVGPYNIIAVEGNNSISLQESRRRFAEISCEWVVPKTFY
jgi:hypothetical protein